MYIVRHILDTKGYDVWSVPPDLSIYEALQIMADRDVGAVLVMEDDELVGIFSERDYARKVVLEGKSSRKTPVREGMTSRVLYVRPDESIEGCMALMTDHRIRHLPVIENERVAGVISIGDVVKALISQQANTIHYLESYITNGHPEIARKVESRPAE
jgi:CBS domain-containing protein